MIEKDATPTMEEKINTLLGEPLVDNNLITARMSRENEEEDLKNGKVLEKAPFLQILRVDFALIQAISIVFTNFETNKTNNLLNIDYRKLCLVITSLQ